MKTPSPLDAVKISESILVTISKVTKPLTEEQFMCMTGSLAVWMQKAYEQGHADALLELANKERR